MALIDSPVFLVGCVRSGTTLLRLMLDHHPKIAFNLESEYLVRQISDDGAFPDIGRYRAWLRSDRIFQHSSFSIDEKLGFVELINDFLDQKRRRDGKEIVGATVHVQFRKLHRIWPNARYIHLCRDGRDVADSVRRAQWAGNVYVAADMWLKAERDWESLRPLLDRNAWIEVRYEELVANPRSELDRIMEFLGVTFSEQMFEYASKSTYPLPDPKLSYQWKSAVRQQDVQRLESKMAVELLNRGYELSGYPRIAVSRFQQSCLYLHSRAVRFLFRLRRYGMLLTLQELFFRRLGLTKAHKSAMRRINLVTDTTLK